ncbi:MAG: AMMECR1 domain-containing protein [Gammaproteobacteria bacterium]|nr:MAG: AMMECR1 domain-containing protein [Gammaproteobacteria bacterium]
MLSQQHRLILLKLARDSITSGIMTGQPLQLNLNDYPPELTEERATFVTLEINDKLRGCIGSLEARRSLAKDIAENSWAAAFNDPRFPAVSKSELETVDIHLSILSIPQSMQFSSERELINQLRPRIDGLILEEGGFRATFLPSVWESLEEPAYFLQHLKQKAGLPTDYWSDNLRVYRYTTESFGEDRNHD